MLLHEAEPKRLHDGTTSANAVTPGQKPAERLARLICVPRFPSEAILKVCKMAVEGGKAQGGRHIVNRGTLDSIFSSSSAAAAAGAEDRLQANPSRSLTHRYTNTSPLHSCMSRSFISDSSNYLCCTLLNDIKVYCNVKGTHRGSNGPLRREGKHSAAAEIISCSLCSQKRCSTGLKCNI